jgi:S-DNA-T family DNA segregation ATPase FtsK/SpoIIIE
MTTRIVHRPARSTRPTAGGERIEVEPPPTLPDGRAGGGLMTLLPVLGVGSSVVMMTVLRGTDPAYAVIGALLLVAVVVGSVAMLFSQRGQAVRRRRQHRERYLEYLEGLRERLTGEERTARRHAQLVDPSAAVLYDVVRDPARLWERRRLDPDFLRVRVGTGEIPHRAMSIQEQGSVINPSDPFMLAEAEALIRRFDGVPQMPLAVPLDRVGNVSVIGDRAAVVQAVRSLLVQVAALHAPDDVGVALAAPAAGGADWDWLKWLPHTFDPAQRDGPVPARRLAAEPDELAAILADELRRRTAYAGEVRRSLASPTEGLATGPRLLVVHDTYGAAARELPRDDATALADLGVTVVHLVSEQVLEPDDVRVRITARGRHVTVEDLRRSEPVTTHGTLDDLGPAAVDGLARMLAPLRLSAESADPSTRAGAIDFPALVGIDDPTRPDFGRRWARRGDRDFLRVPIGVDDSGQPLHLDLKEAAQLGMGPHGLCVGATGSGKSELLRTLVLALVLTHPPDDLAMMLVDYKGGATFAPFDGIPHLAGMITNLEDDVGLVDRAYASLAGEVQRRQQVLKDAGNLASITDYRRLRSERPELPALPHLMVIIDEFGELLTARPDFIELFLSIGRIGRSIGVHLLLSSQRIESGKLRGLETYLSYRLGLRTFSEEESRTVLDTTDAFRLPPLPGFGYLKVDTSVYTRFKAAYVSGAHRGPVADPADEPDEAAGVWPYPALNVLGRPASGAETDAEPSLPEPVSGPTLLDVLVRQVLGQDGRVRQIWLPPLPTAIPLDALGGTLKTTDQGLRLTGDEPAPLRVPIGVLDDPARQRQTVWTLDLTRAGGHVAVIGAPQSGKTSLLRTVVAALALTHTPTQVAVYGLDLVGAGLRPLTAFPQVGGVAVRTDRDRVRRTVEEVHGMLERREELFRERGIDSTERLRDLHATGELPELPTADVVLLVDGFGGFREEFEELDDAVSDLLQRGGGYGIHVVASMLRWNDVRMAAQSTFGTQLELRLNDPMDSSVERRLAETLRPDQPGRVLTGDRLFAHAALAAVGGVPASSALGAAVEHVGEAVREAWSGAPAPPVRVLPSTVARDQLPDLVTSPGRLPIGLDEKGLEPVHLDLDRDQSLIVLGDGESGKTNLIRVVAAALVEQFPPDDLVFAVLDPRRSLRGAVPEPYVGGYASSPQLCAGLAAGIAQELEERRPDDESADVESPSGPRIVVLVDDYDLLTVAGQQPLAPFIPFVPSGRDIGLHFVVTRRTAGASRGLFEPFLMALQESGATGLVLSGERGEGLLFDDVYAGRQPAGRGQLVRRGEPVRLIQTAIAGDRTEEG